MNFEQSDQKFPREVRLPLLSICLFMTSTVNLLKSITITQAKPNIQSRSLYIEQEEKKKEKAKKTLSFHIRINHRQEPKNPYPQYILNITKYRYFIHL